LRIDHPDGLWNPTEYFRRLQESYRAANPGKGPAYVVAEKILSEDEQLSADCPVHGTTGYDFLNQLNGIFVLPDLEAPLLSFYQDFAGGLSPAGSDSSASPALNLLASAKKQLLLSSFISERQALARRLKNLASQRKEGQDLARSKLEQAIEELLAWFPIYRTYVDETTEGLTQEETAYLQHAVTLAKKQIEPEAMPALEFLVWLLQLKAPDKSDEKISQEWRKDARTFVMKFQQLSGPLMAKGLEDTTFYRFFPFVSLNEVGGNPSEWGKSLDQFHAFNQKRAQAWPHSLSATATHDTKRGEDTRARMNVISELPAEWKQAVLEWSEMNKGFKQNAFPSRNDEYLLYQVMAGVWPFQSNPAELQSLTERLQAYMEKAAREAKLHTNWLDPDERYEKAMKNFITSILKPGTAFVNAFTAFQKTLAYFGMFNSLSQTLLKITAPGVPDFYQGCELWDFSLVDPDNRRPVDYAKRKELLKQALATEEADCAKLLKGWQTGLIKIFVIAKALAFRKKHADIFDHGSYEPATIQGAAAGSVCAFRRVLAGRQVIVAAPRFVCRLMNGEEKPPLGSVWGSAAVQFSEAGSAQLRNCFTGQTIRAQNGQIPVSELFSEFPLALLE
jgi:(1->4)-alpha-D-glucan 1-alpha-D-glucosylmutase